MTKARKPTLLVLAAGMGSRYGGLKQIDPIGPGGPSVAGQGAIEQADRMGIAAWQRWTFIAVGLMSVFMMVRHTRAGEESEQAELIRAAPVGRNAPLAAALIGTAIADLIVAVGCVLTFVAYGLPASGSAAFGLSAFGAGLVFAFFQLAILPFSNAFIIPGSTNTDVDSPSVMVAFGPTMVTDRTSPALWPVRGLMMWW